MRVTTEIQARILLEFGLPKQDRGNGDEALGCLYQDGGTLEALAVVGQCLLHSLSSLPFLIPKPSSQSWNTLKQSGERDSMSLVQPFCLKTEED